MVTVAMGLGVPGAQASTAYGDLNNFDCVNDTGSECHGFEIELDDCSSKDITYTYDWNHYGTPKITEDTTSVPGHTNVYIRYCAVWTNTGWSSYTAVPSAPIQPTDGHMFTDPTVNFGGEHFGVGYTVQPSAVKYHWLQDDGTSSGTLALGPSVNVATPTFTYYPPVAAQPARVVAKIQAPEEDYHFREFSDATWVKEIRTTSHTNREVRLRDLQSPDVNAPGRKDWRNGEPDEVEIEWQLLQIDYTKADGGANDELAGAAENLGRGDEIVTRRYEFYAYVGPYDPENNEAKTDNVGPDGIHGINSYSNTVVVGDFLGAQMSAFDNEAPLGLIDHLPDGEVDQEYPTRTVVISGHTNFTVASSGTLPDGLTFDAESGQISGTPNEAGEFLFTVSVTESNQPPVTKNYPFVIGDTGEVLPPHCSVDTSTSSTDRGTAEGDGVYGQHSEATVTASPKRGYRFANWTENGKVVSTAKVYSFAASVNQSLVANFVVATQPELACALQDHALVISWATNFPGYSLESCATGSLLGWQSVTNAPAVVGQDYQVALPITGVQGFLRLKK